MEPINSTTPSLYPRPEHIPQVTQTDVEEKPPAGLLDDIVTLSGDEPDNDTEGNGNGNEPP